MRGLLATVVLIVVLLGVVVVDAQLANQLYLISNGLCLTLGSDQQTVQLFTCGQYGYQQWDLSSGERIQLAGYCLDAYPGLNGALQIKPCTYVLSQSWWFNRDGRIINKAEPNGCLSTLATQGATFYLGQCVQSSTLFYSSQYTPPTPQINSQLPGFVGSMVQSSPLSSPQQAPPLMQPPMSPPPPIQQSYYPQQQQPPPLPPYSQPAPPMQQQPPPSQQLPPVQQQYPPPVANNNNEQRTPISQQIQQAQQQQQPPPAAPISTDISQDHYLCTCIVDASAESCNEAVRASCTVGHLDPQACRDSFSKGVHDKIADDILKLIQNGAKCSTFDLNQLRAQSQKKPANLPKGAFTQSLEGVPTKEDHYLCVCLDSQSSDKCAAAVKAACLVGHIPSGDCYASMSKGDHEGATDHIMRLISSGAGCSQKYLDAVTAPPTTTGGLFSRFTSGSQKTIGAKEKDLCTCLDDPDSSLCGIAIKRACLERKIPQEDCQVAKNKYFMGGVTKHALKLIDHGAQCPAHRSMTFSNHGCHCLQSWSEQGKTFTFPNNCADPGGKKGYAWCKTFSAEHCAGVEGSIEWDRCDNPKFPIRRDVAVVDGNGANADGSLGEEDHYLCICLSETSTDEVCVAAVKAACEVGHLPQVACKASFENDDHQAVSDLVVQLLKGGARCTETLSAQGVIRAKEGETECPEGYFGFPNCRKKVECSTKCGHGSTCDFSDGSCQCLPNFVGPDCSQCVEGTSGRNCLPDGGEGWTLGQGLVYLILFTGLLYAAFTAYKRFRGEPRGITYTKVPTAGDAGPESIPSPHEDDAIALSSDLGGDIEEQRSSTPPQKQEYTGLAI